MQNLERTGERRCQVTGYDARALPEEWSGLFDLVLCDAPCSGEGMMRKNALASEEWSLMNVRTCAHRQREILEEAARVLAPGGRLVYSTCTFSPEENEETVCALLDGHPELELIPACPAVCEASAPGVSPEGSGRDLTLTRRFYPHRFRGEGQYLALFRKAGEDAPRPLPAEKPVRVPAEKERCARAFLESVLFSAPEEKMIFRGDDVYLVPPGGLPEKTCVSPGVLVGTLTKGRLEPHHRFFKAFADRFRRRVILSPEDARVEAYLRGEEIPLEGEAGWAVLYCGDCPLGGVKIVSGRGKNAYPKGLRKV